MWIPAKSTEWQRQGLCGQQQYSDLQEKFFSTDPMERAEAKNLCFVCPVRRDCLQWALEHRQIWGVWGGKDEMEIRRALSVSSTGDETRRRRFPHCPFCAAWPSKLVVSVENLPGGGRWTTAKIVTCTECGFAWKSRTSANAVETYQAVKSERESKRQQGRQAPSGTTPDSPAGGDPQGPSL